MSIDLELGQSTKRIGAKSHRSSWAATHLIACRCSKLTANHETQADGNVVQRSNTTGLTVVLLPQDLIGGDHKEVQAPEVCHIQPKSPDDWLRAEEYEWSGQINRDDLHQGFGGRRCRRIITEELFLFLLQDHGGESLLQEEKPTSKAASHESRSPPEQPPPGDALNDQSARYCPYSRSQKRYHCVYSERSAALFRPP